MSMSVRKMNNYSLIRVSTVFVLTFALVISTFSLAFDSRSLAQPLDNNPPYIPSDPDPANESINVSVSTTLSWVGGDPDMNNVTYDLYFGTNSTPALLANNLTETNYDPGTLDYLTMYYWKIIATDNQSASTEGPLWHFTTIEFLNNPPYLPSDPDPANESVNISVSTKLSWVGGDPDMNNVTYDLYFGTNSTPGLLESNLTDTSYDPGTLESLTMYYWKIIATDNWNASTEGPLWHFTTLEKINSPPNTPTNENPDNGSVGVATEVTLRWVGGDPDEGDVVTYDVFFGNTSAPIKVANNQSALSYVVPGVLKSNTKYYWRIVAWDNNGASTIGPLWHFTTKSGDSMTVVITKPLEHKFYFNDQEQGINLTGNTIVYGKITITAEVTSENPVSKVEFFVDDTLIGNATSAPYSIVWQPIIQFNSAGSLKRNIKVVAYDSTGNTASATLNVTKWRFHILPWVLAGMAIATRLILHTTVVGFFFNFRESRISTSFYAIRAHFKTIGLFRTQKGVLNFKKCSGGPVIGPTTLTRMGLLHKFSIGSFTFIGSLHSERLGFGQALLSGLLQRRTESGGLFNILNVLRS